MKKIFKQYIPVILILSIVSPLSGISQEYYTASDYYSKAKTLISADSIKEASTLVKTALAYYSDNYDLLMLTARMEAWKGNYRESIIILDRIINFFPENREILKHRTDIYYWQNNYDSLLYCSDKYLSEYGPDPDILFKKGLALYKTGDFENSINILESLVDNGHETTNVSNLLGEIRQNNTRHQITAQYMYSVFDDNRSPWKNLKIGYGYDGKAGTFLIYMAGGEIYEEYFQQVETDLYLNLTEGVRSRLYGNYTFNPVTLMWFYGGEIFFVLPSSFEISAGAQQLSYIEIDFSVLTGQITKYLGNNYLALRSSIYLNRTQETNFSALFRYRRYFDKQQWIGISAGYGYLFNDYAQSDIIYQARTAGLNLEYYMRLFRKNYLKFIVGYQHEDPVELDERAMYTFSIGYNIHF